MSKSEATLLPLLSFTDNCLPATGTATKWSKKDLTLMGCGAAGLSQTKWKKASPRPAASLGHDPNIYIKRYNKKKAAATGQKGRIGSQNRKGWYPRLLSPVKLVRRPMQMALPLHVGICWHYWSLACRTEACSWASNVSFAPVKQMNGEEDSFHNPKSNCIKLCYLYLSFLFGGCWRNTKSINYPYQLQTTQSM